MNNKGFTLIELVVTVLILALVMTLGTYSVIVIIKSGKEKNYNLLIKNITSAVEDYAIECKYSPSDLEKILSEDSHFCDKGTYGNSGIKLGELVEYGYLSGNGKRDDGNYRLEDPNTGESISECLVNYTWNNNKITVIPKPGSDATCPSSYN